MLDEKVDICGDCQYWQVVGSSLNHIGECSNTLSRRHGVVLGQDCLAEGCFAPNSKYQSDAKPTVVFENPPTLINNEEGDV